MLSLFSQVCPPHLLLYRTSKSTTLLFLSIFNAPFTSALSIGLQLYHIFKLKRSKSKKKQFISHLKRKESSWRFQIKSTKRTKKYQICQISTVKTHNLYLRVCLFGNNIILFRNNIFSTLFYQPTFPQPFKEQGP